MEMEEPPPPKEPDEADPLQDHTHQSPTIINKENKEESDQKMEVKNEAPPQQIEEGNEKSEPPQKCEEGKNEAEGMDVEGKGEEEEEAPSTSQCLDDPHFATICSFLDKFGPLLRLDPLGYDDLQTMLENTSFVAEPLLKLHIVLLRRVFKSIAVDKWERSLSKFCHFYSNLDGWEVERFGYKNSKLSTKIALLKHLLEAQFDFNVKFKAEVNKLEAADLRIVPLGQDCEGQLYWYQVDGDANLRVYREDIDDESWEVVACTRKGLCELITKLELGDVKRHEKEEALLDDEEDSNGKEIEVKEILRDTGKFQQQNPTEEEDDQDQDDDEEEESSSGDDDSVDDNNTEIDEATLKTKSKGPPPLSPDIIPVDEALVKIKQPPLTTAIAIPAVTAVDEVTKDETTSSVTPCVINKVLENEAVIEKEMEIVESRICEPLKVLTIKEEEIVVKVEVGAKKDSSASVVDKLESQVEETELVKEIKEEVVKDVKVEKVEHVVEEQRKNESSDISQNATVVDTSSSHETHPKSIKEVEENVPVMEPVPMIEEEPLCVKTVAWTCGAEGSNYQDKDPPPPSITTTTIHIQQPSEIGSQVVEQLSPVLSAVDDDDISKKGTEAVVVIADNLPPSNSQIHDETVQDKDLSSSRQYNNESTKSQPSPEPPPQPPLLVETMTLKPDPMCSSPSVSETQHVVSSSSQAEAALKDSATTKCPNEEQVESNKKMNPPDVNLNELDNSPHDSSCIKANEMLESVLPLPSAEQTLQSVSEEVTKPCVQFPEPEPPQKKEEEQLELSSLVQKEKVESEIIAKNPIPTPPPNRLASLVSYGSSSEEEDDGDDANKEEEKRSTTVTMPAPLAATGKRKLDSEIELQQHPPSKHAKVNDDTVVEGIAPPTPIVGEAVEESLMLIVGQGSGTECDGGNEQVLENNQKENVEHVPESHNDDPTSLLPTILPSTKRGRGRPVKKTGGGGSVVAVSKNTESPKKCEPKGVPKPRGRKRKELEGLGVPLDALLEVNGSGGGGDGSHSDRPVRASRRIAQIRLKEEEERRKLEEDQLAQLKAAQLRKQQKKAKGGGDEDDASCTNKMEGGDYNPASNNASSSSSSEDGDDEDDFGITPSGGGKRKKKKKKRGPKKKSNGKPGRPWATDSDDDEDDEGVEEEEEYHYEEEDHYDHNILFNESDHEFSPESDLGEEDSARPSRHARTAKRGQVEAEEETGCKKCGKGDHPEWILLCDKCDAGWHASCLRPQLWVIPEGEWFCPPCQHSSLVSKLNENLLEYDKLLKLRENDILKKQRLAFVGISLENVLPEEEQGVRSKKRENKSPSPGRKGRNERHNRSWKNQSSRRRIILSDEEISDNFIASSNSSEDNENKKGGDSMEEDSDGPIYRLRARRSAKKFDYKEYDELINSACRASDEEEFIAEAPLDNGQEHNDEDEDEELPEEDEDEGGGGGGKNEAYEQHLKEAEQEAAEKEAAAAAGTKEETFKNKNKEIAPAEGPSAAAEGDVDKETDEELLTEKEKKQRKILKKQTDGNRRKKRSFRDLDDFSDGEDNSDEDFRGSEVDDDEEGEEEAGEEDDESDWSGDKDESDDSLTAETKRGGKKGKYGRRDEYLEVGAVRRSTRARRRARISYDESDDEDGDDDDEGGGDKWNSEQSEEDEETPSESDDETYGKVKRKKAAPRKSSTPRFLLGAGAGSSKKSSTSRNKSGGNSKKKRKRVDDEEVDRAWSSSLGSKAKKSAAEEKVERRTRGRKINFKDILDSGESDDDGNVLPKRRRLSSGDDEDEAEASRRLAEKIKAANQREAAMYAERQKRGEPEFSGAVANSSDSGSDESNPAETSATSILPPPQTSTCTKPLEDNDEAEASRRRAEKMKATNQREAASYAVSLELPTETVDDGGVKNKDNGMNKIMEQVEEKAAEMPKITPTLLFPPPPAVNPSICPPVLITSALELELSLAKPVPAPPLPPALAKTLLRRKKKTPSKVTEKEKGMMILDKGIKKSKEQALHIITPSALSADPHSNPLQPSGQSSKKSLHSSTRPPTSTTTTHLPPTNISLSHAPQISQSMGPGIPLDISRIPNPALFPQNNINPQMRSPFHMWGPNAGGPQQQPPPPYGIGSPGVPLPPNSIGKPPPLNNSPFNMAQHSSTQRAAGYPPNLRIPNPASSNNPSLAFPHFRRDGGGGMYRSSPPSVVGLPPGLLSGFQQGGPPERYFGAPSPYSPYGMIPPPQGSGGFFGPSPFDPFRPAGSETFKDDGPPSRPPPPPHPRSSGGPSPSSSPLVQLQSTTKDDHHHPHSLHVPPPESEFGGLVSYFSSQRSEEDMDS